MAMKIQFEDNLKYQQDAVDAVVDVFKGQEKLQSNFTVLAPTDQTIGYEADLGYANRFNLFDRQLVDNTQEIQLRNGLRLSKPQDIDRKKLQYTIEMETGTDRKSTRLNSSHVAISYAVFCLKKKSTYVQRTIIAEHSSTKVPL